MHKRDYTGGGRDCEFRGEEIFTTKVMKSMKKGERKGNAGGNFNYKANKRER
jgi:hypothetical protein